MEPYRNSGLPVDARVSDLLRRMTLREKVAQLTSVWGYALMDDRRGAFDVEKARGPLRFGIGQVSRPGGGTDLWPAEVARFNNQVQKFLVDETRLGIPAINHEECLSGWQSRGATIFPQAIGLASTWDPSSAKRMAATIARQLRAVGARQGLGPVLDVTREPRWGRLEETFGEDPLLVASMGKAYVEGLQGDDPTTAVAATVKHFAGYGFGESGLNWAPAHVPVREFGEVCLFPFEVAIRSARAMAVMNAYAEVDGIPCASWPWLLNDLLRNDWGFDGVVVSDYESIKELCDYHRICADWTEAGRIALEAGVDVELPEVQSFGGAFVARIERGEIAMEVVDRAVVRVLSLKFRLGIFENPYADEALAATTFDTPEDRSLARDIAARSIVLLKNDRDMLPMRRDQGRVAVVGPSAASWRNLLGDYTYPSIVEFRRVYHGKMDPSALIEETIEWPNTGARVVTVLEGIRACVSPGTEVVHEKGCSVMGSSREGIPRAVEAVRGADSVVLVVGGRSGYVQHCTSGEERDRCRLTLPGVQEDLVREVLATGTPAVIVLVGGRTYSIGEFVPDARAVLHAWLPGEEGGLAVAETLFGERNPSGRLPVSIPREVGQIPVHYAHKPSARRSHLWGGTVEGGTEPIFAFGHGLSYTRFEYADLLVDPEAVPVDGVVVVRFRVRNVGPRDGEECVQIYTRDLVASVTRPVKELKAFRRVALPAGTEKQILCEIPTDLLAFIDREGRWAVEPGVFEVYVGGSSADLRLTGRFELVGTYRPIGRDRAYFARITDRVGREEGR